MERWVRPSIKTTYLPQLLRHNQTDACRRYIMFSRHKTATQKLDCYSTQREIKQFAKQAG